MKTETIKQLEDLLNKPTQSLKESTQMFQMSKLRQLVLGLQEQIDSLISPLVIDLDSQCDGSNTTFALGRSVKAVLFVNLNGAILNQTEAVVNTNKDSVEISFAPDTGEEMEAVVLI